MSDQTVRAAERLDLLTAETSEGAQELQRRTTTNTDELGRDRFARLLYGTRISLLLDPAAAREWLTEAGLWSAGRAPDPAELHLARSVREGSSITAPSARSPARSLRAITSN